MLYATVTSSARTYVGVAVVSALLASIGLTDKNGDGVLRDAHGQPARFTLLTQKGNTALERGAAVIRDELKKVGLTVDVVALDPKAVFERFSTAKYDAMYYNIYPSDTDPAATPDFWLSSGSFITCHQVHKLSCSLRSR